MMRALPTRHHVFAELLLADGGDGDNGKYLIRSKGNSTDEFILSVIYKGAPTHHAIARAGDGEEFTLNKNPTGCVELSDLVVKFRTKQPKWPVPLTTVCDNGQDGGGGGGGGGGGDDNSAFFHGTSCS